MRIIDCRSLIELPPGMELSITMADPPEITITGRAESAKEDLDALIADIKAKGKKHPLYPWRNEFQGFRRELP